MSRAFLHSHPGIYDSIGRGYADHRVPDPRIAAKISEALGSARNICNVGAGAGSYEPTDRVVVAVEPSRTMIAQRAGRQVVRARAEALPFADGSFEAATALMTVHHWEDLAAGIAELRRVAALRVIFTFDPTRQLDFWLVHDYLPEIQDLELARAPRIETLVELLGGTTVVNPVLIPWDCTDGFQAAYWRRPERYLEEAVRASISTLAMLPEGRVRAAMQHLERDLASGAWAAKHAELLQQSEMDYAYRLIVSRDA